MGSISSVTYADFRAGLVSKLLGQVELVRRGLDNIRDGGSFTLVSGVTSHDPIRDGVVLATSTGPWMPSCAALPCR